MHTLHICNITYNMVLLTQVDNARRTRTALDAGVDSGTGSSPTPCHEANARALFEKMLDAGVNLKDKIVAEIGSGDGRFLRACADVFPSVAACYGIDCASTGRGGAFYGSIEHNGVSIVTEKRSMEDISSAGAAHVLMISNGAMNHNAQMVALDIAMNSPSVEILMMHHGETLGADPRLPANLFLGGFLGHKRGFLSPITSESILYGRMGAYRMFVYDMVSCRQRLQASWEALLSAQPALLKSNLEQENFVIRDGMGLDGSESTFQDFLQMVTIPRFQRSHLIRFQQAILWRTAPIQNSLERQRLQTARANAEADAMKTWAYREVANMRASATSVAPTTQTTPVAPTTPIADEAPRRLQHSPPKNWKRNGEGRTFRLRFEALLAEKGVDPKEPETMRDVLSHALRKKCVSSILGKRKASQLADDAELADDEELADDAAPENTTPENAEASIVSILKRLKIDDRRKLLVSLSALEAGVYDEFRMQIDQSAVPRTQRQWTLNRYIVREFTKELKRTCFTPVKCRIALDERCAPLTALDAIRDLMLSANLDVLPCTTSVRQCGGIVLEQIEETHEDGIPLVDNVVPRGIVPRSFSTEEDAGIRARGEEAWSFCFFKRLRNAISKHCKWNIFDDDTPIVVKVSADKATFHDKLGIVLYGFTMSDERCGEGGYFQSREAQFVCGAWSCNAENIVGGGDSLTEFQRYGKPFLDAVQKIEQDGGLLIRGKFVKVQIVHGGDWKYLMEVIGFSKEGGKGDHKYPGCCGVQKARFADVDADGFPIEHERLELARLEEYREAVRNNPPILPFDLWTNINTMNAADARAFAAKVKAEYTPRTEKWHEWFQSAKTLKKMKEALRKAANYYGVTYHQFCKWEVDSNVLAVELDRCRMIDLLRVHAPKVDVTSKSETELCQLLKRELLVRSEIVAAYNRVHVLTVLRANSALAFDSVCICVGHGNCRIQGAVIDMVLQYAINSERKFPRGTSVASMIASVDKTISDILTGTSMARVKFKSIITDGKHRRTQTFLWQQADAIIHNPEALLDVVYFDDAEMREKVSCVFADVAAYTDLLKKSTNFTPSDFTEERKLRRRWGKNGIALWGKRFTKTYVFMAISGEIAWYMKKFKNLYRYSNQGWEGIIRTTKSRYNRCTSRGGATIGGKSRQYVLQPLLRAEQRYAAVTSGRADFLLGMRGDEFIGSLERSRKVGADGKCHVVKHGGNAQSMKTIYAERRMETRNDVNE